MKFEFPKPTTAKLQHLNVRTELAGDEPRTAIDLKFDRVSGNDILNDFAPGLREAMYCRSANTEAQGDIDGVDKLLPNLRFPKLAGLAIDEAIEGATVTIGYGIGEAIRLSTCKVNKFRLELAEGGSVTTSFRVQCSEIPDGALDKLSKLLGGDTEITLTPPELQDDKPAAKVTPIKPTKGREKDATELFVDANTPAHAH